MVAFWLAPNTRTETFAPHRTESSVALRISPLLRFEKVTFLCRSLPIGAISILRRPIQTARAR
jgi:hypothetical protein